MEENQAYREILEEIRDELKRQREENVHLKKQIETAQAIGICVLLLLAWLGCIFAWGRLGFLADWVYLSSIAAVVIGLCIWRKK